MTGADEGTILRTVDLHMVYRSGSLEVPALRGVDFEVRRGEFVAIVGPSGCGKSTLLHILGGLARPTSGRVTVEGVEISAAADSDRTRMRREKIGFVFQRFNLLPTLTVAGNLEMACQIRGERRPSRDRVIAMLEMVGLPHKAAMKPLDLSAGEQQRVAIARALINEPALVLADEPTGNLDTVNSGMILELFAELNERMGQTLLMITHNPEAAAVAHRTIEMRDGRIVEHPLPLTHAGGAAAS